MHRLILASASPRRRELLTQEGFSFDVHPAHIPEDPRPEEDPIAYVVRLAREKAQAVFNQIDDQTSSSSAPTLPSPSTATFSANPRTLPTLCACCACSPAAPIASSPVSPS